jgi:GT2 family glycosyltransferase/predicted SAM-dependent methyltransferase
MPKEKVLIEVGAGDSPHRPSYLHFDVRGVPGLDVVGDAKSLPFATGVVDEIYCAHMLEHLSYEDGKRFLAETSRVLKVRGHLELSCPDIARVAKIYAQIADLTHRVSTIDELRSIIYGGQTHQFDFHKSEYDFKLLSNLLIEAGFKRIRELPRGRGIPRNQRPAVRRLYELHVEAWKGTPGQQTEIEPIDTGDRRLGSSYLVAELALRDAEINTLRENYARLESHLRNTISSKEYWRFSWRMLEIQLERAHPDFGTLEKERTELNQRLGLVQGELDAIRHSFGYKAMKSYARVIDRLLPNSSRRGYFRKVVTESVRILTEESIGNLLKKSLEKIRRREFRLVEPTQRRIMKEDGAKPRSVSSKTVSSEFNDDGLEHELATFLSSQDFLEFPSNMSPRVSVIVVTYNKAHYAYQCLRSLLNSNVPHFELIVVDNASSDQTSSLLRRVKNTKVILNTSNQYFSRANNQGASEAKGEYLHFLNQDVFVHRDCVSALMKTLDSSSNIGAVGAKLVSRDGKLLEAGSIVWKDGICLGYGRGDNPDKPEYCYVRDVDYSSAACLMVRREAFRRGGGFDEDFIPAYYEDADLCMKLWARGFRVAYQPLAVATHIEFSVGSLENAAKLMAKQQHAFARKHESVLVTRLPCSPANVLSARDRRVRSRILVIDDCVPKPADGSGYPRMFLMLKAIASLGYRVTFLPANDATPTQPETQILNQMGIEILWGNRGIKEALSSRIDFYDVALISRPHNVLSGIDLVRETNPHARIIYDVEALWHRRERLSRQIGFPPMDPQFANEENELSLIDRADYIISASQSEKTIIEDKLKKRVILWGYPASVSPTKTPFEKRSGLLFVGGFKSAPAHNDDAVIYFAENLLPKIRQEIPDCQFTVAATNAPNYIKQLSSESTIITERYVKFHDKMNESIHDLRSLEELYESCRVFVAPIRFGAGIMLKLVDAMSFGLPCVVSRVAAEGFGLIDGQEAMVADDDNEFIEKTIRLYSDYRLWKHIREHELDFAQKNFDPATMQKQLEDFLRTVNNESGTRES